MIFWGLGSFYLRYSVYYGYGGGGSALTGTVRHAPLATASFSAAIMTNAELRGAGLSGFSQCLLAKICVIENSSSGSGGGYADALRAISVKKL